MLRPDTTSNCAPEPLVPIPAFIQMPPLRPSVAALVVKMHVPLFPETVTPELNSKRPLVPPTPASALCKQTEPLLAAVPSPLATTKTPPVFTKLRPDMQLVPPPIPLVPLPVVTIKRPAEPARVLLEPTLRAPLLPDDEDPELKDRRPLVP